MFEILEMFRERRKEYPSAIFENREILKYSVVDHLKMKKGMLFGLSHEEKIEKMNLLHFPVFTSKKFCDFKIAGTVH